MHNILWEDEWQDFLNVHLKNSNIMLVVENTAMINEITKLNRRYNIKKCFDFEHIIQETCGLYLEGIKSFLNNTVLVHLTGYTFGSKDWHTHFYNAPEQSKTILNFLLENDYNGTVISEAQVRYQKYNDFIKLNSFFNSWQETVNKK